MFLRSLILLCAVISHSLAYPKITTPAAGASLTGGSTISIKWSDEGTAPSISDLSTYQLFLCAGSNDEFTQLATLVSSGDFSDGNTASGSITTGIGGSVTNAYFLEMIAVATAGGTVTLYSSRFSLTGMTGSFSTTVKSALSDISGTSGPDVDNEAVTDSSGTSAAGTNSYGVEYTLQTGSTRYAPMIPTPHTTITATNTSPLFPTSAVTYATTYMGSPDVYTTLTQSATYSASSIENTASAASMPSDDMAKFLRRWRD